MRVNVVMICALLMRVNMVVRINMAEGMGVVVVMVVVGRLLMRMRVVFHGVTPIRL